MRVVTLDKPVFGRVNRSLGVDEVGPVAYLNFEPGNGYRYPLIASAIPSIEGGGDCAVMYSFGNPRGTPNVFTSIIGGQSDLWHISYLAEKLADFNDENLQVYCALLNATSVGNKAAHDYAVEIWTTGKEKWKWMG